MSKRKKHKGSKSYTPKALPKIVFAQIKTTGGLNINSSKAKAKEALTAQSVEKPSRNKKQVVEMPVVEMPAKRNEFGVEISAKELKEYQELLKKYNEKSKREMKNVNNREVWQNGKQLMRDVPILNKAGKPLRDGDGNIITEKVPLLNKDLPDASSLKTKGYGQDGEFYKAKKSEYQFELMRDKKAFDADMDKMKKFLDRNWRVNSDYQLKANMISAIEKQHGKTENGKALIAEIEKMGIRKFMAMQQKVDGASLTEYYQTRDENERLMKLMNAFGVKVVAEQGEEDVFVEVEEIEDIYESNKSLMGGFNPYDALDNYTKNGF